MTITHDRTLRQRAAERQRGLCFYCGLPIWTHDADGFARQHGLSAREASWLQCTAEHLIARRDGGQSTATNIVAACRRCNLLRHHRPSAPTWSRYREIVQRRLKAGRWYGGRLRALFDGLVPQA
jgi:5-methylcytosine-specific restriction endonuclease McrA